MNHLPNLTVAELSEAFKQLKAMDPEACARSEVTEGFAQLGRYLFLRGCWRAAIDPHDTSWIENYIEHSSRRPRDPYAGVGLALKRMLDLGVDEQSIVELVRGMQGELIFGICYLLSDPTPALETLPDSLRTKLEGYEWKLVEVSPNGGYGRSIEALHESVLETEPLQNEMRPKA